MTAVSIKASEIERVAQAALVSAGATPENARPVAHAIARAEAEGNSVCGLFYLPIFCGHLACGKVDGRAQPEVTGSKTALNVDARNGFAHPAIQAGLPRLTEAARAFGIAALAVRNSYNCLALSHHVTPLAEQGLIGLCVSNAPASVSPPGATARLFGTNPIAFAAPMNDGETIVVDQSMSAVTKTAMIMRRDRGEDIPIGWAQDRLGQPTTNAAEGLLGSLLPAGGQKGANISLLVELLAAALTGSKLSTEASMFGDDEGGPPNVGQFMIAIDPAHFSGGGFATGVSRLAKNVSDAGARLPGKRTLKSRALENFLVEVDQSLWGRCLDLTDVSSQSSG